MTQVIFARETVAQAPRDRVWEIVADPIRFAALDPRLSVVSVSGAAGTVPSGYVTEVRPAVRALRLELPARRTEYSVTEAEPGVRIVTEVRRNGRLIAVRDGRLGDAPEGGTHLIWMIRAEAPPGLGWLVGYRGRQELSRWLGLVVRAARE
jgi:ligand-binding SRPBCC domain-containing protein